MSGTEEFLSIVTELNETSTEDVHPEHQTHIRGDLLILTILAIAVLYMLSVCTCACIKNIACKKPKTESACSAVQDVVPIEKNKSFLQSKNLSMPILTRSAHKRVRENDGTLQNSFEELPETFRKPSLSRTPTNNLINNPKTSNGVVIPFDGVRGLINLGASCYINSVVQALMHTPPLRNYVLTESHTCNTNSCQLCVLIEMFKEYNSGNIMPPMSLHRLLYLVWLEAPGLAGTEQQDAHEFYMTYIQLLHSSCLRSKAAVWHKTLNPGIVANSTPCACIIDQIYAGILESNLTCLKCKTASSKREIFFDISLELNADKTENLYNCLENYTRPENLDEIFCPNCGMNQAFIKKLNLIGLPNVLNINFKRFARKGLEHKKLIKHVEFPFDLDTKLFTSEYENGTKSEKFSLLAVISHDGSMNSGHYTAYVRQAYDVWLHCNDHKINVVTPENVLETEAYILVYERKSIESSH